MRQVTICSTRDKFIAARLWFNYRRREWTFERWTTTLLDQSIQLVQEEVLSQAILPSLAAQPNELAAPEIDASTGAGPADSRHRLYCSRTLSWPLSLLSGPLHRRSVHILHTTHRQPLLCPFPRIDNGILYR